MISAQTPIDDLTLNTRQELHVRASVENTFEALLEQLGPENANERGPMPMKLEAWPGGRWFRDLGANNGHCWGTVQAIKQPFLLEISGPLFMSYPVANNLQYRLTEEDGGTLVEFRHTAFGLIIEDHRKGVSAGWGRIHERVQKQAEAMKSQHQAIR